MKKDYSKEFGRDYRKRSKESIKAEIRYRTSEVNKRLSTVNISNINAENILNNMVKNLQDRTMLTKNKPGYIGLGLSSYRNKESLIQQARELKAFMQIDIESDEGALLLSERYKKSKKSFEDFYGEITDEDYRKMTESFGALGNTIVNDSRASDDFVDAWKYASEQGKTRFVDLWKQTEEESKGKGWNTFQQMEYFKELVKNYMV